MPLLSGGPKAVMRIFDVPRSGPFLIVNAIFRGDKQTWSMPPIRVCRDSFALSGIPYLYWKKKGTSYTPSCACEQKTNGPWLCFARYEKPGSA